MADRPRVAVVSYDVYAEAGAERVVLETMRRTQRRVRWCVVSDRISDEARTLAEWRRAPAPAGPFAARALSFAATAGMQVRRARADLVHSAGPLMAAAPDLLTVHFLRAAFYEAVGAARSRRTRLHLALERRFARSARLLAAPSRAVARDLERRFPGARVTVVPNGVDRERFRPDPAARDELRGELGVPEERRVLAFVGNGWTRKGLPVAIEAAGLLAREGHDVELWVVGQGDPARYAPLADATGAAVRFLGARPDVERVYAAADAFVFPSAYETFALTAFEAAASGLPVVATAVGGIEELVEPPLVVGRSGEAVARALGPLLADDGARATAGEAARAAAAPYTWERSVETLLEVYDSLLPRKTS